MAQNLLIFTKEPDSSNAKTRLRDNTNSNFIQELHTSFVLDTLELSLDSNYENIFIFWESYIPNNFSITSDKKIIESVQQGKDFSSKFSNALSYCFNKNNLPTSIIGTDCPYLTKEILNESYSILERNIHPIGATQDNGFYLLGLASSNSLINFSSIINSENQVDRLKVEYLNHKQLASLNDIDTLDDLEELKEYITNNSIEYHRTNELLSNCIT